MADIEFTTEELAAEEWRPVVTTNGRYSVSSLGRVRRDAGNRWCKGNRILRPYVIPTGYPSVGLWGENTRTAARVHCLVAECFLGPRPTGFYIDHVDGRKTNNRVLNLRYVTPSENSFAAVALGLAPIGNKHRSTRLSDEDAVEVFARRAAGEAGADLAREFGVSQQLVCDVIHGRRRHHATNVENARRDH